MCKKDFWMSILFNLISVILLIEHWCGLDLAFEFMIGWTIISLFVHIYILRDHMPIWVELEDIE
jgi:hypothetical protein